MKTSLKIEGMHCQACVSAVRNALSSVDRVTDVAVDLENKKAVVTSAQDVEVKVLMAAVEDAGYDAA